METIKYKLLGFLLLFLISFPVIAQNKVYIESFTHDPMDQAAKVYGKYDSSGNMYAIVKVRPTGKDFKFSFGYMASSVQGEHDNETWLYVQKNARKVTIKRDGFTTINNEDLGMTLEAGQTYIMNLSYTEPDAVVYKQWLKFSVNPADANAIVRVKREGSNDYEIWGQTINGAIAKNIECGRYHYQIVADNYETSEGLVTLDNPDDTHTESVILNPNFGYLQIDNIGNYQGAQIIVDNKIIGTIPYTESTKWPIGKYNYSVTNGDLFKTYNGQFTIKRGEKTVLKPKLESNAAEVSLQVNSPAEIYIDGVFKATQKWSGWIKSGRYEVECRRKNHRSTKKTISVEANQSQTIVLDSPEPIVGRLSVNSTPLDADIIIDGENKGKTPKTINDIIIGEHNVVIRNTGYKEETRKITIEEGKTYELNVFLGKNQPATAQVTSTNKKTQPTVVSKAETNNRGNVSSLNQPKKNTPKPQVSLSNNSFYIQPMFQAGSMMSFGAAIGGYVSNFNIEGSFLMGMGKETMKWSTAEEDFSAKYIGARVGYGFEATDKFRITPQAGVGYTLITGDQDSEGNAMSAVVGCRFDYLIVSHFGISLTPEYGFSVNQSEVFSAVADYSSSIKNWGGGFNAKIGIYVNF